MSQNKVYLKHFQFNKELVLWNNWIQGHISRRTHILTNRPPNTLLTCGCWLSSLCQEYSLSLGQFSFHHYWSWKQNRLETAAQLSSPSPSLATSSLQNATCRAQVKMPRLLMPCPPLKTASTESTAKPKQGARMGGRLSRTWRALGLIRPQQTWPAALPVIWQHTVFFRAENWWLYWPFKHLEPKKYDFTPLSRTY